MSESRRGNRLDGTPIKSFCYDLIGCVKPSANDRISGAEIRILHAELQRGVAQAVSGRDPGSLAPPELTRSLAGSRPPAPRDAAAPVCHARETPPDPARGERAITTPAR
jgi:hypothetical protein